MRKGTTCRTNKKFKQNSALKKGKKAPSAIPEETSCQTITVEMLKEINKAWANKSPDKIYVSNFGLLIRQRDLRTLAGTNWLNGNVINFYMNLIIERGKQNNFPNVYALNTYFYPKLKEHGHEGVKLWTKKVDIFAQDMLVMPIHINDHWSVAIADFTKKTIKYYDSMGKYNRSCLLLLKKYLEEESLDKKNKTFDTSDWKLESVRDIPLQYNISDCGVFCCSFAKYISANKKMTFSQKNMPCFRKKMTYEILHSMLL